MKKTLFLILFISITLWGCKKEDTAPKTTMVQYSIELYDGINQKAGNVSNDFYFVRIIYKVNDGSLKTIEKTGKGCNKNYLTEEFDLGKNKELYMKIESNLGGTGILFNSKIIQINTNFNTNGGDIVLNSKSSNSVYVLSATLK